MTVGRPGGQAGEPAVSVSKTALDAARLEPAGELRQHAGRRVEAALGDETDSW